ILQRQAEIRKSSLEWIRHRNPPARGHISRARWLSIEAGFAAKPVPEIRPPPLRSNGTPEAFHSPHSKRLHTSQRLSSTYLLLCDGQVEGAEPLLQPGEARRRLCWKLQRATARIHDDADHAALHRAPYLPALAFAQIKVARRRDDDLRALRLALGAVLEAERIDANL